MINVYIVTRIFESNCSQANRNNIEWLRKQDRTNGTFNVAPYPKDDYFRRNFIMPILDDNGFIKEDKFNVPLVNKDGISYCVRKWCKSQPNEVF